MGHNADEIASERLAGSTLAEIAANRGISRQRVHQILKENDRWISRVDLDATPRRALEKGLPANLDPDVCWPWQRQRQRQGYGRVRWQGKVFGAHRLSYQWWKGPIPDGLQVLHHCDNPPCVNPAHLWLGTVADNMHDRDRKGRTAVGGHGRSSKLRVEQVGEIRTTYAAGHINQRELAQRYGITQRHVSSIVRGLAWRSTFSPK